MGTTHTETEASNEVRSHKAAASAFIIGPEDLILITGATGFIGGRLVENLLNRGFRNLRCMVRASGGSAKLECFAQRYRDAGARIEVVKGNLVSRGDCLAVTKGVAAVYHLAAARGEKSFPDAFMNSVVTTRNLLDACVSHVCLRRFVNVSSFAVYSNNNKPHRRILDESCPVEPHPELRGDAYSFAKIKQEEIVTSYGEESGLPYVIVRPGHVYGAGNEAISGRVGIGTFGVFLHLGGSNTIPFTYVDNCADAIALAGLVPGIDKEIFNITDDDLPSSRRFLRQYKRNVERFTSVYCPHLVSYGLCWLWERYSSWSEGQLPPAFNRKRWHANWKKTLYSNQKLKSKLGWAPPISTAEGMRRYFASARDRKAHA